MGEHRITHEPTDEERQAFVRALLDDLDALEQMLRDQRLEADVRRIGAEQEMFLVDAELRPAPVAPELLAQHPDPRLVSELGRFNLEANLRARRLGGRCLAELHAELEEVVARAAVAARRLGAEVLLTGILPTLRASDLGADNMSPCERYYELDRVMRALRGEHFRISIRGIDELETAHDNVMFEACNTSFQIHLQVAPREFAALYNLAQAASAPVLAVAANSPLLLGRRLWAETRVALLASSVDVRSEAEQARGHSPRVTFGNRWVKESILEIYREDVARFRVVLAAAPDELSTAVLARGEVPRLAALTVHNGTVYRWNRPCYGILDGRPHLRIEHRALPAGPSIVDEVANAAFFYGLIFGMGEAYGPIDRAMAFEHARGNFFAAARHGLAAQLTWVGGRTVGAASLVRDELLPLARAGLRNAGVDAGDAERYLAILDERVRAGRTGASWAIDSLARMDERAPKELRDRALTAAQLAAQRDGLPVSRWPLARLEDAEGGQAGFRRVGSLMSTELFTLRADDLVDLAASLMDWQHLRNIPVEDEAGRLVGLVSVRALLRLLLRRGDQPRTVASVMDRHPTTVTPETPAREALRLLRSSECTCLPVVDGERLVGIVTAHDFLALTERLLGGHDAPEIGRALASQPINSS